MDPNQHHNALNKHDMLHWYEIQAILGQGGFGITYLARDTNLDQLVAIKEYLPTEFSTRDKANTVQPISENHTEIFDWGKKRFLDEAKTLAQFRHPNVVRVNSFFENNNTGYMVMEYEEGTELGTLIKAGESFDEARLRDLLLPVIDGLEQIHAQGFIHRDIKPANIFIRTDGSPVLIDFGSARQAIGEQTRTLTSLVTPGFAPFEQYHDAEGKQGPWTDIYSMGATCYSMITGKPPIDALKRGMARLDHSTDAYLSLEDLKAGSYSEHFLRAIDKALEFKETDRPQDVASWRAMLVGDEVLPAHEVAPAPAVTADQVTEIAMAPTRPDTDLQATQIIRDDDETAAPQAKKFGLVLVIVAVCVVALGVMFALNQSSVSTQESSTALPAQTQAQNSSAEADLVEQARIAAEQEALQLEQEQEQARIAAEKEQQKQEQARLAEEESQRQAKLQQQALEKKRKQEAEKKRKAELAKKKAAEKKRQQALAKQKAEEKKRQQELALQQQKQQQQTTGQLNLSGTYVPDEGLEEVVLVHTGNRIKGTIGTNGSTIEGLVSGNRIEFIFNYSRTGYGFKEGTGEFTISADGNRLLGSRFRVGVSERTPWNLTRSTSSGVVQSVVQQPAPEPKPEPAKITPTPTINLSGAYEPDEGFEELVLVQQGNKISGTIGTNGSTISGTLKGNTITFVFNYSRTGYGFKDGYGKFKVSADGSRLTGTRSKAGFPVNSGWSLTRKLDN